MTAPRTRRRPRPQPPVIITLDDLRPFAPDIDEEKAEAMIEDAVALAVRVAPCLRDPNVDEDTRLAARAIIRSAILRWNDQGTGTLQTLNADVFGVRYDNRTPRTAGGFLRQEIRDLAGLCGRTGAFSINLAEDTFPPGEPPWMDFVDP